MHRLTTDAMTLSDGTLIPKGARIIVQENLGSVPDREADPEWGVFDAWRHTLSQAQLCKGEQKNRFTSTSAANMGFGHGKHACPGQYYLCTAEVTSAYSEVYEIGRFFAALEIKILLCKILMGYRVSHVPDAAELSNIEFEHQVVTNPDVRIAISRRQV